MSISMMLHEGLMKEEATKFERLEGRIAEVVHHSTGNAVRVCSGVGTGSGRQISFTGPRTRFALTATEFLETPDLELLSLIQRRLEG